MCIYKKKLLKSISFKYLLQRIRKRKRDGEKLGNITYTLVVHIKYSKFYFSENKLININTCTK